MKYQIGAYDLEMKPRCRKAWLVLCKDLVHLYPEGMKRRSAVALMAKAGELLPKTARSMLAGGRKDGWIRYEPRPFDEVILTVLGVAAAKQFVREEAEHEATQDGS